MKPRSNPDSGADTKWSEMMQAMNEADRLSRAGQKPVRIPETCGEVTLSTVFHDEVYKALNRRPEE